MRKLQFLLVATLLLISCSIDFSKKNNSQECIKIWNNYLNSWGNSEDIAKIESAIMTTRYSTNEGVGEDKVIIKYPDRLVHEMTLPNGCHVKHILNRNKAISISFEGVKPLDSQFIIDYKEAALIIPEFHFQKLGYKFNLLDDEIIKNRLCYRIKIEKPQSSSVYYIVKDSLKLVKAVYKDYVIEVIESKRFSGILLACKVKYMSSRDTMLLDTDFQFNVDVNDSVFNIK